MALGRAETWVCQRRTCRQSSGIGSLAQPAKPTVTSVVMSAMRVTRAGDEFVVGEPRIHFLVEVLDAGASALGQRRNLLVIAGAWQAASLQARRRIAERLHHRIEAVALGDALPRGDETLLGRRLAHQGGFGWIASK